LDKPASAAHWGERSVTLCLADTMAHEPSGLDGDAKDAMKLIGADAFLGRAKKMHGLQPHPQGNVAGLEDSSDFDGERLATLVALADANAGRLAAHQFHTRGVGVPTMRANRTVRPYALF